MIDPNIVLGLYIIGIILFILALRWMSESNLARRPAGRMMGSPHWRARTSLRTHSPEARGTDS